MSILKLIEKINTLGLTIVLMVFSLILGLGIYEFRGLKGREGGILIDASGVVEYMASERPEVAVGAGLYREVVGSKTGKKYHLPECPGAKQINSANLVTFDSFEQAEKSGYTAASNCPGLRTLK